MQERIAAEIGAGHRVMNQVSMGEILRAGDASGKPDFDCEANRAINAKRLDFVIIDRAAMPVAAIEYQGNGHHLDDTSFLREALRRAGLTLIERPIQTDEATLRSLLAAHSRLDVPLASRLGHDATRISLSARRCPRARRPLFASFPWRCA